MRKPRTSQRKVVLSSSDDDYNDRPEHASSNKAKPLSESSVAGKAKQNVITLLSSPTRNTASRPIRNDLESVEPSSQPRSPRKKGRAQSKTKAQALPKGKTLHSFFASASQAQSSEASGAPKHITKIKDTLDSIQDDVLDDASDISTSTREGREDLRRYKRSHGSVDGYGEGLLSGSQKFRKITALTNIGTGHSIKPCQPSDFQPWTDKYAPLNLGELAVHKRKVDEVRQWLNNVFCGRIRKSVLILRGPAGAGKSTTVSLLAKEAGIQLQEWKSPSSSNYASEAFSSATAQFDEFLNRASKYGYLETAEDNIMGIGPIKGDSMKVDKQAIFVEEFPLASLQGSSSALRAFRNSIVKYLATNTPTSSLTWKNTSSTKTIVPLILLISESLLNCSSISDVFTAHRLFGADLLTHHGVTVIDFNPIAPTLLLKGLEVISRKEAVRYQSQKYVSQSLLKKLAGSGDMRSAVSSLEFIYIQGNEDIFEGQKISSRPKHNAKSDTLSSMEKETLEVVTQREMSLGLFHAVGKVVYNKRENASDDHEVPLPPTFMPENTRSKASDVDFSTLIDELGTDINTFVSALHENYTLSCNASSAEDTLDSVVGCVDALSDTDVLLGKKDVATRYRSSTGGGSSQSWRNHEILFNVATRGIVFSLPYPVRRSSTAKSSGKSRVAGNNAFKMYYPVSSRLWRQEEDYWDLLDLFVQRNQRGELRIPLIKAITSSSQTGISGFAGLSFRPKQDQEEKAANRGENFISGKEPMESQEQILLSGDTSARYEMLLERIPYISLLHRARHSKNVYMKDLDRLARFTGIDDKGDELSESDEEVSERAAMKSKRTVKIEKESSTASAIAGLEDRTANRLMLSDDDIIDD